MTYFVWALLLFAFPLVILALNRARTILNRAAESYMFLYFISSIKANKQSVNCEWLLWCPLPPPYIIKIDIFLLSKFSVRSTLFNLFDFPFPTVSYTSVFQYLDVGFTSALISVIRILMWDSLLLWFLLSSLLVRHWRLCWFPVTLSS